MFASLPGVSAPPPFGGSQRDRRRPRRSGAAAVLPDVARRGRSPRSTAATRSAPPGNVRIGGKMPIVPVNSVVRQVKELENDPDPDRRGPRRLHPRRRHRPGRHRHPRRLRPGQRPARGLHPRHQAGRRLDAHGRQPSRTPCPRCRPSSPTTSRSASSSTSRRPSPARSRSLATEGVLGAVLTGLMVLLFLRDWRSVIVVVLNIPFASAGRSSRSGSPARRSTS